MIKDLLRDIAESQMPQVPVTVLPGTYRWNVIDALPLGGNLGIELGVAAGSFSTRMVKSGRFARFFGVDLYGDTHDTAEYKRALLNVGLDQNYHLLRMSFDEALNLFPDHHFDFIYVDGFAHTGEEGGRTLLDWYAKLKPGGIMAGDDYDLQAWPLVVWAVHNLVAQLGLGLSVTDAVEGNSYNRHRSWFFTKPLDATELPLKACQTLMDLGDMEKASKAEQRQLKLQARLRDHK